MQEIKTECPLVTPQYDQIWFAGERKGYAGTLVLTKRKPIAVSRGIGIEKFDAEGRTITLEFGDFYVVNVYVPSYNTASAPDRREYRIEWDSAFLEYVTSLPKPAILTGDFNVARGAIASYSDKRVKESPALYYQVESEFRENFERLLDSGFLDAFRVLNPFLEGVYSWWGSKNANRLENQGSRLDYILVSKKLLSHTLSVKYHKDILGSDHCPVSIMISPPVLYKSRQQEELVARWQTIDWDKMREHLFAMQKELAEAAFLRDWEQVDCLQKRIMYSETARALAVYEVSKRNPVPGVDGVRWETDLEKAEAAVSLSPKGYRALPYLHMQITEKTGRTLNINVPAARDKAMQLLCRYCLLPVAESMADKRSFSAREGRSLLDAHAYLIFDLQGEPTPDWIVIIDVKMYYTSMAHKHLLDMIPIPKTVLREILKAGVMVDGQLFPTEQGISLGASLSPILGNMLLDGLQSYLYDHLYPNGGIEHPFGCMTRYADDMVILAKSREQAELIMQIVTEFLAKRGLGLNYEKSGIYHISMGFNFLGKYYQRKDGVLEVKPSDRAMKRFERELELLILGSNTTYRILIERINDKLSHFAKSHRTMDAYMAFRHIDAIVVDLLLRKLHDRNPTWRNDARPGDRNFPERLRKYWVKDGPFYVFVLPANPRVRVMRLAPLRVVKHKPCKLDFNPYLDADYYDFLKGKRDMQKGVGKYKAIWNRQNGKCAYCGYDMLPDQEVEVVERIIGKGRESRNLIYVHTQCAYDMFIGPDKDFEEFIDLSELLGDLLGEIPPSETPYFGLREYFHLCEKPVVSLTFDQIEDLIGEQLGWEAEIYEGFWYDGYTEEESLTGWRIGCEICSSVKPESPKQRIAETWISQGYRLHRLHLAQKRAVFHRTVQGTQGLRIPSVLLQQRIPDEAAYEIQSCFNQVIKKFGLKK